MMIAMILPMMNIPSLAEMKSDESDNDIYEPRLTCLKNLLNDPTNIHIVNREIKAYACGCTGCGGYIDLDDHLVWKVEKVGFYMCCCFRKYH
jgi:hypothetical protein